MTLAPYEPPARISRLVEWATEADAAYALAQKLAGTAFCPPQFRRRPDDAMAAMLAGLEVGLTPIAALRAFDVIEGQAAPRAITLRALVQSRGHEIELVESSATRCKMRGRRAGADEWQTVTWTIDRAASLNLAHKDNWRKQPQAMLIARATSEICRLVASDAILGLGGGYSAEEYADSGGRPSPLPVIDDAPISTAPEGMRRMGRASARGETLPEPEAARTPEPEPRTEPPQGRPLTAIERAWSHAGRSPVPEPSPESVPPLPGSGEQGPEPPDSPSEAEAVESVGRVLGGTVIEDDLEPPTEAMRLRMFQAFSDAGWNMGDRSLVARKRRLEYCSRVIGHDIGSSNELTRAQVSAIIDALVLDAEQGYQPP